MDAIHFHVRSEGQIIKKAVYIAIGINMDGIKEVLGTWVGENESAKFWLSVMNGLKNRGLQDILIACVDGLTGFPAAIEAVYPKTEIQQCIIQMLLGKESSTWLADITDDETYAVVSADRPAIAVAEAMARRKTNICFVTDGTNKLVGAVTLKRFLHNVFRD